jgi:hypothetical protein
MEDSIQFDLYGSIKKDETDAAKVGLSKTRSDLNCSDVLKLINSSINSSSQLIIAYNLGLSRAEDLIKSISWSDDLTLLQAGWSPDDANLQHCERHNFYYGGCLGCHICSNNYQK